MRTITVFSGLALKDIMERSLIGPFCERTGAVVRGVYEPTAVLRDLVRQGERPDVIIGVTSALHEMAEAGEIRAESLRSLVRSEVGVCAAASLQGHALTTVEDVRDLLQRAPSIAYSATGASGSVFERVLDGLGLTEVVREKAVVFAKGFTAEAVRDGRAEIAIQQLSELAAVPNTEILGSLPAELGAYIELSVAAGSEARAPDLAREFIDDIRSARYADVYEQAHLAQMA